MSYNLKLTGKGNSVLKKEKSGLNPKDVSLALKQLGECGAGFDLDYGFVILPDFNGDSGDIDGYVGLYIVDGALVIDTVDNVRSAICAFRSNDFVSATGVNVTTPSTGNLAVAATRTLTATVLPTGALQTGTWTSSLPGVATVSSLGVVTGVSAGTTVITFTTTDGAFTDTVSVTVA